MECALFFYIDSKETKSMNSALVDGLIVVLAVSVMSVVVCPILLWVLPDRRRFETVNNQAKSFRDMKFLTLENAETALNNSNLVETGNLFSGVSTVHNSQ